MNRKGSSGKDKTGNRFQNLPEIKENIGLMAFLTKCFPEKSRSAIKSLLSHKLVLVNQKDISLYNYNLNPGDQVVLLKGKSQAGEDLTGIKILFEDDYLIVIEKAAGLLSISTSEEKERTAYSLLSRHVKNADKPGHVFVLHRLDKETSGVMMFAKNKEVQSTMQNNWREMVLERSYTAIVEGKVLNPENTITSHLIESKAMKIHKTKNTEEGQLAVTHYKVISQLKEFALVNVVLETGRKNQIRVHMQDMGNPIIGDKKYGAKTNPIVRLGLHASLLVFRHPISKDVLRFESPIPKSFLRLVK